MKEDRGKRKEERETRKEKGEERRERKERKERTERTEKERLAQQLRKMGATADMERTARQWTTVAQGEHATPDSSSPRSTLK